MKFIPKKQTDGLVNRYLQAHQYSLNQKPQMITPNPAYFTPEQTQQHLAAQGQLISRPSTVTTGPVATPGSVSGIDNLIELWKAGQTSQTAPVATEPKWRMPIKGEVPAGTVDKMKTTKEANTTKQPASKLVTKPKPKSEPKPAPKQTTKPAKPAETGISRNARSVKPVDNGKDNLHPRSSGKPVDNGGFIGHVLNQMSPGTTNKSNYRYPKVIEKLGNAAAGNPTPGNVIRQLTPNPANPIGHLLHWMNPSTTNAPK